jgi:uncharacterized spore protein YtfJ
MSVEDPIKSTLDGLFKVLNIENVVGEPIESDDKILIPVTRMGMAFGAGMGEGEDSVEGSSKGSGAGGGAGVEPLAFIVVDKKAEGLDSVKVLPLTPPDPVNRAIGEIGAVAVEVLKEWQKSRDEGKGKAEKESKPEKPSELTKEPY